MSIDSKSDRDRVRQKARQNRVRREYDKMLQEVTNSKRKAGIRYLGTRSKAVDEEWKRQIELMPQDTRDLTGRIMGDPIPGDPRRPLVAGGEKCRIELHKKGDL